MREDDEVVSAPGLATSMVMNRSGVRLRSGHVSSLSRSYRRANELCSDTEDSKPRAGGTLSA
jgi:hypothetical protein